MKNKKLAAKILAGVMVALMFFSVLAGALAFIL